jgi:acetyl-CoA carboxylase biotin carboxylase subunit
MFKKLLIANRGEIAVRVIRACRDLGVSPVAVYSEADRDGLHVKLADQAVEIGPASAAESYLNIVRILQAARDAGAEAIHPGYGFLSESDQFAQACRDAGIVFVGPSVDAIRIMGTKVTSRAAAQAAGIPIIPGTTVIGSLDEAVAASERLGFPVLLKADSGGGGKGMRIVATPDQMAEALESARIEAASAFGDPAIYLERYLLRPRHIEIQVLGDTQGNLVHLGERECSIQRRYQKILEESPSPFADERLRARLGVAAVRLARSVGYYGAGTVEFLVDSNDPEEFYFLEMNTRLQVEHAVTEMVTGVDLVCEQIRIAAGEPLGRRQEEIQIRGAALECRIYAEDPANDFLPAPGIVTELSEPAGPGIRSDSALYPGYEIPIDYDPLISKLVAFGADRDQAIRRMLRALGEYRVGGVPTGVSFLRRLVSHPEFRAGRLHNRFLEDHDLLIAAPDTSVEIPLIGAALQGLDDSPSAAQGEPRSWGASRWKQAARPGRYSRKW